MTWYTFFPEMSPSFIPSMRNRPSFVFPEKCKLAQITYHPLAGFRVGPSKTTSTLLQKNCNKKQVAQTPRNLETLTEIKDLKKPPDSELRGSSRYLSKHFEKFQFSRVRLLSRRYQCFSEKGINRYYHYCYIKQTERRYDRTVQPRCY